MCPGTPERGSGGRSSLAQSTDGRNRFEQSWQHIAVPGGAIDVLEEFKAQ